MHEKLKRPQPAPSGSAPPTLQRAAIAPDTAPPIVHEVLQSPGQPLDAQTRAALEPSFGQHFGDVQPGDDRDPARSNLAISDPNDRSEQAADTIARHIVSNDQPTPESIANRYDLGKVRVHSDADAAASADAVQARAYTVGQHVVFGAEQYHPQTTAGRYLLAHELTHTAQNASPQHQAVLNRVPQEPTLGEAQQRNLQLPTRELNRMDVHTLNRMSSADRRTWYVQQLGMYESQLKESAAAHTVPVQLLATVILNELADINMTDIIQSDLAVERGSLGIAQIQIDTAIRDNLFPDMKRTEEQTAYNRFVSSLPNPSSRIAARIMRSPEREKKLAVNRRLQIPQHAIDAAARELRILIDRMVANRSAAWQMRAGFTYGGATPGSDAQSIYGFIAGGTQREKEMNLGTQLTGAYNSPGIITAANAGMGAFPNANIHGSNSRRISADLYDFGLFRP